MPVRRVQRGELRIESLRQDSRVADERGHQIEYGGGEFPTSALEVSHRQQGLPSVTVEGGIRTRP